MSQTTTMTVRISGALSEFVASNVGENGSYENISEYVRDLRPDNDLEGAAVDDNLHNAVDCFDCRGVCLLFVLQREAKTCLAVICVADVLFPADFFDDFTG